MAKKTAKITLGGDEYTIRAFNIGELERVTDLIQRANGKGGGIAFGIVRIALERAEPKVDDPNSIEATMTEILAAGRIIQELAGVVTADPPKAQETGEA